MTHYSSIQLFTDDGTSSDDYNTDVAHIEDGGLTYTSFQVTKNSRNGAVWVVYSEYVYGSEGSGKGESCVATPDKVGKIKAGFRIKSIQAFNVTVPCICLFEHFNYRGNKRAFQATVTDISEFFPTGEIAGASSAITTSGKWHLHAGVGHTGPKQEVDALKGIIQLPQLKLNDKVRSVDLLRAS